MHSLPPNIWSALGRYFQIHSSTWNLPSSWIVNIPSETCQYITRRPIWLANSLEFNRSVTMSINVICFNFRCSLKRMCVPSTNSTTPGKNDLIKLDFDFHHFRPTGTILTNWQYIAWRPRETFPIREAEAWLTLIPFPQIIWNVQEASDKT